MENMGSLDDCLHFWYPAFLETVRSAGLGFCLGVGHANLNGVLDEFLSLHLDYLHLHDNDGTADLHGVCGSGTIDFVKIQNCGARSAVIERKAMENVDSLLSYFGAL